MRKPFFEKEFKVAKVDRDTRTVFGFAIVSTVNGEKYWDLQSDHIPEIAMKAAAEEFAMNSRIGSDQHTGEHLGDIPFLMPVMTGDPLTYENEGVKKTGLYIGYQPHDDAAFELIANGERTGFSIGGYLLDYAAEDIVGKQQTIGKGMPDSSDVYVADDKGKSKKKPGKKGKIYRSFKIQEISLVTRPAMEGATVDVVKHVIAKSIRKSAIITSEDDGHQHIVDLTCTNGEGAGCTSYAQSEAEVKASGFGHSHDFVVDSATGEIVILANAGHTHTADKPEKVDADFIAPIVETVRLAAPPEKLTPRSATSSVTVKSTPITETTMTEAEIAALNKRVARAEKLADLTDVQRLYSKSLADAELETFINKSASDRDALVKTAVAYTATDGTVYFTNEDPRMIKMAKSADEDRKQLALEKAYVAKARFEKAAGEHLAGFAGDDAAHLAVATAIEGIADEAVRKSAWEVIDSGKAAVEKTGRMQGSSGSLDARPGTSELSKAETVLKTAITKYQTDHKIADFSIAFAEASASDPATRDAYNKVAELRRSAS